MTQLLGAGDDTQSERNNVIWLVESCGFRVLDICVVVFPEVEESMDMVNSAKEILSPL